MWRALHEACLHQGFCSVQGRNHSSSSSSPLQQCQSFKSYHTQQPHASLLCLAVLRCAVPCRALCPAVVCHRACAAPVLVDGLQAAV
jgi:hypothetical protein